MNKKLKDAVINKLKELKIQKVIVTYDGQGDEGQFNGSDLPGEVAETALTCPQYQHQEYENGKFVTVYSDEEMSLESACEELGQAVLEKKGIDWYNNEGGFGEVEISANGDIKLKHNYRIESSEYKEYNL